MGSQSRGEAPSRFAPRRRARRPEALPEDDGHAGELPRAAPAGHQDGRPLLPGEDEERSWQDQPGVYPPGYN